MHALPRCHMNILAPKGNNKSRAVSQNKTKLNLSKATSKPCSSGAGIWAHKGRWEPRELGPPCPMALPRAACTAFLALALLIAYSLSLPMACVPGMSSILGFLFYLCRTLVAACVLLSGNPGGNCDAVIFCLDACAFL